MTEKVMENTIIPSWLNNSFLSNVLQSTETDSLEVEVLQWTCNPAVPPGTNFMSLLHRVVVKYRVGRDIRTTNFIVKVPLEAGNVCKEFVEQVNGYQREVGVYKEVFPAMFRLKNHRLAPKSYHCPIENVLVLEDLTEQGYKMTDRLKQLDLDHSKQSLSLLAKLHALSIALQHKSPELMSNIGKELLTEDISKREVIFNSNMKNMLKTVEKLKGCERYTKMIKNLMTAYFEKLKNIYLSDHSRKVLCQGDIWSGNILFKYNDLGEVVDSRLVDFQLAKFSSFATDIILFLWTCPNFDTRENHREEMFEVYLNSLNRTLQESGCTERLTKVEFNRVMKMYAPFSLAVISGVLPMVLADPNNMADFSVAQDDLNSLQTDNSPLTNNYRSKYYIALLPDILRQLEDFGAFPNV